MKIQKPALKIRLLIFLTGIIIWSTFFLMLSLNNSGELASANDSGEIFIDLQFFTLLIFIWNILPHIVFILGTIRMKSFMKIIIPGAALICGQLYNLISFNPMHGDGAQAGLELLVWPVVELIFLVIGFLFGFIIDLTLKLTIKRIN